MAYNDQMSPKEELEWMVVYRKVMSTPEGKQMLTHQLIELGFWDYVEQMTEYERGRRDYAMRLLDLLGIRDLRNMKKLTEHMLRLPTYKEGDHAQIHAREEEKTEAKVGGKQKAPAEGKKT